MCGHWKLFPSLFFIALCRVQLEVFCSPSRHRGSVTAQRRQSFSQGESLPATGDKWVVSTIPVFLKQVINVKSSLKYLLPQFHNKNIGTVGTQRSVGQSKTKMLHS